MIQRLEKSWSRSAGKIDDCVETLCQQGCLRVYSYIKKLEEGRNFPAVMHLNAYERAKVLEELVSIMEAYDGPCDA